MKNRVVDLVAAACEDGAIDANEARRIAMEVNSVNEVVSRTIVDVLDEHGINARVSNGFVIIDEGVIEALARTCAGLGWAIIEMPQRMPQRARFVAIVGPASVAAILRLFNII